MRTLRWLFIMLSKTISSTQPYRCTLGCFAGNLDGLSTSDLDPDCFIGPQEVQSVTCKPSQRKRRKTRTQIACLLSAFDPRRVWTREEIDLLSERTGLSPGQVYKWNWDFRKNKKKQGVQEASWLRDLQCCEVLRQSSLDEAIYRLVLDYKAALVNKRRKS